MDKTHATSKKTTAELFQMIRRSLEERSYYFTAHAMLRSEQRVGLNRFQILRILAGSTKYHESRKDTYSDEFEAWNYSIRGTTLDGDDVRIIISFDENSLLIITVINLDE